MEPTYEQLKARLEELEAEDSDRNEELNHSSGATSSSAPLPKGREHPRVADKTMSNHFAVKIRPRLRNKLQKIDPNDLALLGIKMVLDEEGQGAPPESFPAEHITRIVPPKKKKRRKRRVTKYKCSEICASLPAHTAVAYIKDIWLFYSVAKEAVRHWPKIRKLMMSVGIRREELVTLGLSTLKAASAPKKRKPTRKRH